MTEDQASLATMGNLLAGIASSIKPDPRDPDHSRTGMFVYHNCWKCQSGEKPCVRGNPGRCEFPHARND